MNCSLSGIQATQRLRHNFSYNPPSEKMIVPVFLLREMIQFWPGNVRNAFLCLPLSHLEEFALLVPPVPTDSGSGSGSVWASASDSDLPPVPNGSLHLHVVGVC